jgi:protein CpxP
LWIAVNRDLLYVIQVRKGIQDICDPATPGPSLAAPPEPGMKTGAVSKADNVEARIKDLHAKLAITPAQEELWNNVAQAMRDNGKTMEALIKARSEKAGTMTAVDDLKSYGEIADAHADGIKKFIPVFEPLYASMSDAQKKDADKLFHHQDRAKPKAKGKSK